MEQQVNSFLKKLFNLREGAEEKQTIIENIKDDADFSSARFWTLVFAIGLASIGLNINSIPVIIGAMLISPLMGPIVSIGLALSINDWGLMRRSFRNLLTLVIISIVISSIYFAISPISNAQSELLARTQPTIFDVLIAIFGGIAGFIGVSRVKQSNVIPGVAIATALMPPLCTVGYGLGTLQPKFIFGALYLFLINSIFICLSALLVAKYLNLPKKEYPDENKKKQVRNIITAIIFIITIPAIYLAVTFVDQNNFNQNSIKFIETVFENKGYVIVYKNISYNTEPKFIELAFLSDRFTEDQINGFEDRLLDFGLNGIELRIRQDGFSLTEEEWQEVLKEVRSDDEKLLAMEAKLESERQSFQSPARLLDEARSINNKVTNIAIGDVSYGNLEEEGLDKEALVALVYATSTIPLNLEEGEVVTSWLTARLSTDNLIVNFYPPLDIGNANEVGR
ncbi:MAG: TIGR00341 family protein [Candidatus Paceibacterota bacterium]